MTRPDGLTGRPSPLLARLSRATLTALLLTGTAAALALPGATLAGCEKKKPPPAPPPPPPPAPKAPDPVDVGPILQSIRPDARVQFPQSHAPLDESFARAAITLADALAKGDADKLSAMLTADARILLDQLTGTGEWEDSTANIEAVRVVGVTETPGGFDPASTGGVVTLAIQQPGSAYLLAWQGTKAGGSWVFSGAPAAAGSKTRASDFDSGAADPGDPTVDPATPDAPDGEAGGGVAADGQIPGAKPMQLYMRAEIVRRGLRRLQKDVPDDQALAEAIAKTISSDAATVLAEMEKGKADALARRTLSPQDAYSAISRGVADAKGFGGDLTDDQAIQFYSNVVDMPEPRVRALFDEGKR